MYSFFFLNCHFKRLKLQSKLKKSGFLLRPLLIWGVRTYACHETHSTAFCWLWLLSISFVCSSLNTAFDLKLYVCVCLFQSLLWLAACSGQSMWCSCWMAQRGWDWRTTAGRKSSLRTWPAASTWPTASQTRGTPAWPCCSTAALQSRGWSSHLHTTSQWSLIHWQRWHTWTLLLLWAVLSSMLLTMWWFQRYKHAQMDL